MLKLPLCSINPNFASNHGTSSQNPGQEESRRQEGNRLPLRKPASIQTKTKLSNEELEVSSLVDKFLKSVESKPADRAPSSNNEPLPPIPTIQTTVSTNGKVRSDRRCGAEFPLDDGNVSECNPNSPNHCCSKWGYCGPGAEHCDCPECVDYRTANSPGKGSLCNRHITSYNFISLMV